MFYAPGFPGPFEAEGCANQVFEGFTIRQRPSTSNEAMGESDIGTSDYGKVLQVKLSFALRIRLPVIPAAAIRVGALIFHGGKYVINERIRGMVS